MDVFEPIHRKKLYEELAERLEKMILEGHYGPGESLPSERELMDRFKVGRPSVRQALFVLEKSGLIEISPGNRARVALPKANALIEELSATVRFFFTSPDGVRRFREVRQLFEGSLVRYAARHATDADIEDLRETLTRCESLLGQPEQFHHAAEGFHSKLADITGNPVVRVVEDAIAKWLFPARMLTQGVNDEVALEAHRRILEAIVARDPERAEQEMIAHLQERTQTIFEAQAARAAAGGPGPKTPSASA